MSMKKTDLAKSLGLKVAGQMRQAGSPGRFGQASSQLPDRREQRKLDQAAGLVPFAAKLHGDLIKALQDLAAASGESLNEVADRVIRAGLTQEKPGKASKAKAETAEKPEKAEKAEKPKKSTKQAKET